MTIEEHTDFVNGSDLEAPEVPETETLDESADDGPITLLLSGNLLIHVDGNGEVIGMPDAPEESAQIFEIAAYYGPRKQRFEGKIAGLEAEKAFHLKRIADHYDPQIKQQKSGLAWLEARFREPLRQWALQNLLGKARKTTQIGLLTLSFRKTTEKLEIVDEATAVQWAKLTCPDAVKVKESLLVSLVPAELRETLKEDSSGLRVVPPSDVFTVK